VKDQIKYYAPEGAKNALKELAIHGESMSDIINQFVLPHLDLNRQIKEPIKPPSNVLKTRINDDEKEALTEYLNSDKSDGITISKLLNLLLRKELEMKKLLSPVEFNTLIEINKNINELNLHFNSLRSLVREEGTESLPDNIVDVLGDVIEVVQDVGYSLESFKLKNGYK
jgi:antitoxin component of RelBE/YafQ-DinJ toxin-antitoxin module